MGEGSAGRVALERRPLIVRDLTEEGANFARAQLLAEDTFIFYCAVPLIAKDKIKGVIEVFLRTPFDPPSQWLDFFSVIATHAAIAIDSTQLFEDLQSLNAKLVTAYDETLEGWSRAMDFRDKETEGHTQRVTQMTLQLARLLGVGETELSYMRWGALLHDIGKIGIPDSILLKPDNPTDEEWVIMRKHPEVAYEMLSPISFLRPALDIPYCHHEKWDGTGYPRGLKGEQIPLAARIFAIADVWDALRSDRPYRKGWSEERMCGYVRDQTGKHFDPQVVDAFLRLIGD
jgi:putative nucleotidyltransferase with HDIG domain